MKVLLIQADGKWPNLALMKISTVRKELGHEVFCKRDFKPLFPLDCRHPDEIWISSIFDWNKRKVLEFARRLRARGFKVHVGGYGVNDQKLDSAMEHAMPDYSLYGIDYSMGYTSRGCIRKCPWCTVWKKEGKIRHNADITEFLKPGHKKLLLLDNNLLASPEWELQLEIMIERKLKVSFAQGLDIRLIDEENAEMLSRVRYYDRRFRRRRLYFAFDSPGIRTDVEKGIEILNAAGIPNLHLRFYVLVGYPADRSIEISYKEDMERVRFLLERGIEPYVMPYNHRRDSYFPHLYRWVHGRWHQFVPWTEYDHGNSLEVIKELER